MLSQIARQIFQETLLRIDAREAVRRAVRREGSRLVIFDEEFDLPDRNVFVIAIGKAAYPMARGFNEIAGEWVKEGIVSGIVPKPSQGNISPFDSRWKIFEGGHPIPNEESLVAARACLTLLRDADSENSLIVFLISGGGSAMMELPRDPEISLDDLRALNQVLITSGATIAEINTVRRTISDVKGGGLALCAPKAAQRSLIIADTAPGDLTSVASGPSLAQLAGESTEPFAIIEKFNLLAQLPTAVVRALENYRANHGEVPLNSRAHVLLDNKYMARQAAAIAAEMGFVVEIDRNVEDSFIVEGCEELLARFINFRKSAGGGRSICYVSGGEFGCTVKGTGIGGRNSETVLRLALSAAKDDSLSEYAILSAGTDGIDGNSPAAGAVADETLFEQANSRQMNPLEYLENSDSFAFFNNLGGAITTGATGTNVRDLRLLLAK